MSAVCAQPIDLNDVHEADSLFNTKLASWGGDKDEILLILGLVSSVVCVKKNNMLFFYKFVQVKYSSV